MIEGLGLFLLIIAFIISYGIALYDDNNERR